MEEKQDEMRNKILTIAERDSRIGAVILNGSRANPSEDQDKYQDYDIVFVLDG